MTARMTRWVAAVPVAAAAVVAVPVAVVAVVEVAVVAAVSVGGEAPPKCPHLGGFLMPLNSPLC